MSKLLGHLRQRRWRKRSCPSCSSSMVSPSMWSLIEACALLGATVSLSSGFHPKSNGQFEGMNQEMETMLCCAVSQNPFYCYQQLLWVEYSNVPIRLRISSSSRPWRERYPACLSRSSSDTAAETEPRHGVASFARLSGNPPRLANTTPGRPPTRSARRCGSQHVTFLSGWNPRN